MIVFLNGVFDILTPAHFNLFTYARSVAGDDGCVVVAIDTDEKTTKDKGLSRPIFNCSDRTINLCYLKDTKNKPLIDYVVTFDTNEELYETIKDIQPDFIIKGSDWKDKVIGSDISRVLYFDRNNCYSTSDTIFKILKKFDM